MSFDVAKMAVEAAVKAGADYADARTGTDETESLTVRNQEMEGIDRATSSGVGVRVLAGGRWGFAATSRQDEPEVVRTATLAVEIAKAASRLPGRPVELSPVEPVVASWRGPMEEDPFTDPARGEGRPVDGGHPPDADRARRDVRGGRPRPVPSLDVVRLVRGRRDRPGGRALGRRAGGDGHRRRRRAATLVPQLVPRPHQGGGMGARPHARTDRGGGAHRPGGRRAVVGARVPQRGHDADPRQRSGRAAGPRVDRPSDRARPRPRDGRGLRRFVVPHDRGPRQAEVRQPARLDHGRRHAVRRARHVRLRRRRGSRATRADPGGRHLPELPDQPRDGARGRARRPTAPAARTAGRTCRSSG